MPGVSIVNPVETSAGGQTNVAVSIQDQTTAIDSSRFRQIQGTPILAVNTVVGAKTVTVDSGHTAAVGELLDIANDTTGTCMQSRILISAATLITIADPISEIFTTGNTSLHNSIDNILLRVCWLPHGVVFKKIP